MGFAMCLATRLVMIFERTLQVGRVRMQTVSEIPLAQMERNVAGDTAPPHLSRDEDGDGQPSMEEPSIADLLLS